MGLDDARKDHHANFIRSVREGGGWPVEADEYLNNSCRRLVQAMHDQHGECWLGKVNLYDKERHGAVPVLWKWDGSLVRNFSCAFVVPTYDETLERLIRERDDAPYTTTAADAVRVGEIIERITALGGEHLYWA